MLGKQGLFNREAKVLREKFLGDNENGISDEKGRENINGIVKMPQKDAGSQNQGGCQGNIPDQALVPKNHRHQERKAGMPGKKIISAEVVGAEKIRRINI